MENKVIEFIAEQYEALAQRLRRASSMAEVEGADLGEIVMFVDRRASLLDAGWRDAARLAREELDDRHHRKGGEPRDFVVMQEFAGPCNTSVRSVACVVRARTDQEATSIARTEGAVTRGCTFWAFPLDDGSLRREKIEAQQVANAQCIRSKHDEVLTENEIALFMGRKHLVQNTHYEYRAREQRAANVRNAIGEGLDG